MEREEDVSDRSSRIALITVFLIGETSKKFSALPLPSKHLGNQWIGGRIRNKK